MSSDTRPADVSNKSLWAGWILSALLGILLLLSAVMKFLKPAELVEEFAKLGWHESSALYLGIVELGCAIIFVVPRTSVLGAILLTGYFGGAIATHVRIGDPFIGPVVFGVLVWGSLWLRDSRLRALVPL